MSITRNIQRVSATVALDGNRYQRQLLYIFTYLAALTALQILHLALDDLTLTLGLTGAVSAGFVYSYYVTPRFRAVTTYAVSILAVGLSLYYAMQIQAKISMYGNYLGVLLGILTALLAYKAFSPDDHRFILMVCVVFLLFSSVASYDLKFMLLLPLFLIFSGITLYIANQVDVSVRVTGTTGGGVQRGFRLGWGFIMILGRAILGVIILSVVAYVSTPHSTQENRNLMLGQAPSVQDPVAQTPDVPDEAEPEEQDEEAEVGISDEFDLRDQRRLVSNPEPVLQMKSHRSSYLRAQVYDVFTGSGWVKSPRLDPGKGGHDVLRGLQRGEMRLQPQSYEIKYVPLLDFPSPTYAEYLKDTNDIFFTPETNVFSTYDVHQTEPGSLTYNDVRQEITLLDDLPAYYFSTYQPYRLENISKTVSGADVDMPLVDDSSVIRPYSADGVHPRGFTYTVWYLEPQVRPQHLAEVYRTGPEGLVARYTQLPEGEFDPEADGRLYGISEDEYRPISPRTRNYVRGFADPQPDSGVEGPLSVYEKVLAIYRFLLSDEFTYDRQFEIPQTMIDRELEITEMFLATKTGYCRYFASTMAVMCRINGIPARIVTGYSPGTYSFIENAYIYRNNNAHAWVEVYIDGYGWLMFDPTPGSTAGPAGNETRQVFRTVIDFLQDLFIIDPAGTQQTILRSLGNLWAYLVANKLTSLSILGGLVVLFGGAFLLMRWPRRRPGRVFAPDNEVIADYLAIGDSLARLGLGCEPGSTARVFLGKAAGEYGNLGGRLDEFTLLYERAAFSGKAPTAENLARSRETAEIVREFVAEELRNRKRG